MQEYSLPFLPPSHTILRLPPDTHIEPHVQQRPNHDVYHEQQRVVHPIGQEQVQHAEAGGHQKKGDHGRAGSEAHRKELVVDVGLVRKEGVLALAHSAEHDTDNVQRRNHQHAEGYQDRGTGSVRRGRTREHAVFHGQQAEQVAKHQAARVAHENLTAALRLAEHVVGEKGDEHADGNEGDQAVNPKAGIHEQCTEHGKRDHAQTGGQAIDSVNQVDGVRDEDNQEEGQGDAEKGTDGINPEQPVEVVDVKPGKGEHQRGQQLDQELLPVTDTDQVVGHTHNIEEGQAGGKQQKLGGRAPGKQDAGISAAQQAQGDEQANAEQHDGEEAHTAQAGNQVVVDLTRVRGIEQPLAERDQQDIGDDNPPQDDCRHKGAGYHKQIFHKY